MMAKKSVPLSNSEQIKKLEDAIRKYGDSDGSRAKKIKALMTRRSQDADWPH